MTSQFNTLTGGPTSRGGGAPRKTQTVFNTLARVLLDAGPPSTLIIQFTTNLVDDAEPLRIRVPATGRLRHDSDLLIDQLRAIDTAGLPRVR